jgi:DNA repair exonuclease SbcCD nuclease subunit
MVVVPYEDISNDDIVLRFLSVKDPHASIGFTNRIRFTSDEDQIAKYDFLRNYAIENNVTNVIFTGDLTNSNDEKKWLFKQYIKNKQMFQTFTDAGINLWSVAGNHDLFNGIENTDDTVFGELVNEKIIKHISVENLFNYKDDKYVCIFGVDYSKNLDLVKQRLSLLNSVQKPEGSVIGVVFHSHVTPSEIAVTDFTYESLIKEYPNIDLFICGHYHGGFKFQHYQTNDGDKAFINDWSFQRVVRDYYNEMDVHVPQFSDVKIAWSKAWNKFIIGVKPVTLPHKTYAETFKPKIIDLIRHSRKEHFTFFEKIRFDDIKSGSDDVETLKLLAEEDKELSPEVIQTAIQYLSEAVVSEDDEQQ